MSHLPALELVPEYREYIWGGKRLRPEAERTAEAWVVYEGDRIASGPLAGQTLAEASAELGERLLGSAACARSGTRFPLLIKLLDCADWLSLQVHPDNRSAVKLEGEGQFGKTEAWYFIDAQPGAEILCGLRRGVSRAEAEDAIRARALLPLMRRLPVQAGESVSIPAGMIHALGPGLLLYEVQQTSDWTYRVYDWGRPETPQRPLHIEKSVAASKPSLQARLNPAPAVPTQGVELLRSPYFRLEFLAPAAAVESSPGGTSFHALTCLEGQVGVTGKGWQADLGAFQSLLIPADAGVYRLRCTPGSRILRARAD